VSRGAVGNWETGKDISRASVQKIVETFDVSYDWLASGRGQPLERHIHDLLADYEGEADDFISLVELLLQERLKQLRDRKRQK
jgi:transcriptional regulator with XRE-family HTH domain